MTKAHKFTLGLLAAVVAAGSITPAAVLTGGPSPKAPTPVGSIPAPHFRTPDTHAILRAHFIPAQNQTLTAVTGNWTGNPAPIFTYQWKRCDAAGANCVNIINALGGSYTLVLADVGATIRVAVTGTNSKGSATAVSAATPVITAASGPPPPSGSGTGPSQASCSLGGCGAIQLTGSQTLSWSDGAGSTSSRNINVFYPTGLSGSVPVVVEFGDGAACATLVTCVDGAEAFANIASAKKFVVVDVRCQFSDHGVVLQNGCNYETPDVAPFVTSFAQCGSSHTATCNDSLFVQYLIQTYLPAHMTSYCTGGACTLDTSRVFLEGGSKGSSMTMQAVCSPISGPLIAGAFADSTLPNSATITSSGPPSGAPAACPYHLQGTPPSSYTFTPTGHNSRALMMGFQNSIVDKPLAYTGGANTNGHWTYGEDDAITYITGPDFGCSAGFATLALTRNPAYTGPNTITGHVHNCNGSAEAGIVENGTASCHAGACDGNSAPANNNAGFQFGPEMWSFWTTGTLF